MRNSSAFGSRLVRSGFSMTIAMLLVIAMGALAVTPSATAQDDGAFVRVLHAAPDAGSVDVYIDGELTIPGFEYATATDFLSLPAGDYDVDVVSAGGDIADAAIVTSLTLENGVYYDVSAVGLVADGLEAVVYEVDAAPTGAETARIRVVHNSFDAGPIDVALADGTILFEAAEYPFETDYIEVGAGTYDLQVLASGTDTVALDIPGVALASGVVYDVHAVGLAADGSLGVVVLTLEVGAGTAAETGTGGEESTSDDVAENDDAVVDTATVGDDPVVETADGVGGDGTQSLPTSGVGSAAVQNTPVAALALAAAAVAAVVAMSVALRASRSGIR